MSKTPKKNLFFKITRPIKVNLFGNERMAAVWSIGAVKRKVVISLPVLVCLFLASTLTGSVSGYPEKSFALYLPTKDVSSYTNIWGMPSLTAFTLCFWIRTNDKSRDGTAFSYGVPGSYNEILVDRYGEFALYVGGRSSKVLGSANDGKWHHICFTWQSRDGAAKFYKDGIFHKVSSGLNTGYTIRGGGSVVLGQEQDSLAGGFSSAQAFQGYLANLNMWSYVLPATEIQKLSESCHAGEGNVYKWNDFIYGVRGKPAVVMPSPCERQE